MARFDDDSWVVCLQVARVIKDGFVECPVAGSPVASSLCLACRHLAAVSDERDPVHACAIGEQRPAAAVGVGC